MSTKNILKSRTTWINVGMAAGAALWEQVGPSVPVEYYAVGAALVNIFLRRISKDPVSFL